MQHLWVICVDPEVACSRVMKRNSLPEEEARKRVNFQMANAERVAQAGAGAVVIWNDGTLGEFETKVQHAIQRTLAA